MRPKSRGDFTRQAKIIQLPLFNHQGRRVSLQAQKRLISFYIAPFKEAGFGVEPNKTQSESSTGLQSAESTGSLNQPECTLIGFTNLFHIRKLSASQRIRCTRLPW